MSIADWWAGTSKQLGDAEEKLLRSVALTNATLLVASRNVGAEIRGEPIWTGDDVIKAAQKYEKYLNGTLEIPK